MRNHAQLVIIGAGIVGCSAAYELTKLGWKDIVVIDRGPLYETGGSTSHAPGITFGTNPSRLMQKMAYYTTQLYRELSFEDEPVWYPVGTIEVATIDARMRELWRKHGHNGAYDVESHIISPEEVQDRVPMIDPGVLKGGLFRPSDGNVKAWQAAGALALKAISTGGAEFYGQTKAIDIELNEGRIRAVLTDKGRLECEQVLLCTNIWGSVLADRLGVTLPMMACAHHYAMTEPLPELADETSWISQPPCAIRIAPCISASGITVGAMALIDTSRAWSAPMMWGATRTIVGAMSILWAPSRMPISCFPVYADGNM